MIEKFYHEKWWDYSNVKFNIDGYIALPMSAIWGAPVLQWDKFAEEAGIRERTYSEIKRSLCPHIIHEKE